MRDHHLSLIQHAIRSKHSGQTTQTTSSIYQDSTVKELLNKLHIALVQRQCIEDLKIKTVEDILQLIHEEVNIFSEIFSKFSFLFSKR